MATLIVRYTDTKLNCWPNVVGKEARRIALEEYGKGARLALALSDLQLFMINRKGQFEEMDPEEAWNYGLDDDALFVLNAIEWAPVQIEEVFL